MQTFRLITAAAVSGTDSFGRRVLSYEPQMEEGGGGGRRLLGQIPALSSKDPSDVEICSKN